MSAVPLAPRVPHSTESAPSLESEETLWLSGLRRVAGVDEAGRGAWAGPVVAAAVILRPDHTSAGALTGVRDSKQLSPRQRQAAAEAVRAAAWAIGVGVVPTAAVDEVGLSCAGQWAFWRSLRALGLQPDYVLVDGFPLWSSIYRQAALVRGDCRCLSIAAASVIAKVTRDEIMAGLDGEVPGYGFACHKGYGTPAHQAALARLGPSSYHRRSFRPVAALLQQSSG